MARLVNISDVCNEIFAGGDAPKNNMSIEKTDEFSIPIYSNGEAESGLYGYTNFARVKEPSITISARGTIGYTAIRNEPFVPIVRLISLTPNRNLVDIQYLYYAVQNYHFDGSGTSIPQLTVPMLREYSFPLPEMGEQQHIASILNKLTSLISLRKQQLAKLDELVKARFVEMFGDPVQNDRGWKISRLEDVCSKLTDGTHFSPTNLSTGAYKYITAKNIKSGGIDLTNITYVSKSVHDEIYSRCNPELGDVLYIKDGVTTGIAITNPLEEPFTLLSSVALLKQDRSVILGEYLCGVLNNQSMYDSIRANMGGAAITRLTIKKLCSVAIPVAPLGLQEGFAKFDIQIKKQKLTIQQSLDKLEVLKKALMQEYLE